MEDDATYPSLIKQPISHCFYAAIYHNFYFKVLYDDKISIYKINKITNTDSAFKQLKNAFNQIEGLTQF